MWPCCPCSPGHDPACASRLSPPLSHLLQAAWVASLHTALGEALDAAAAAKEQRSPLLLRAAMTSYVGVVLPVFFGPYLASSARSGPGNSSTLVWGIVVAALVGGGARWRGGMGGGGGVGVYFVHPTSCVLLSRQQCSWLSKQLLGSWCTYSSSGAQPSPCCCGGTSPAPVSERPVACGPHGCLGCCCCWCPAHSCR